MENREWLVLACWLVCLFQGNMSTEIPQEYKTEIFEARKPDEWKSYWHIEKYKRCYYQIPNHVELACKYDIYKVPVGKREASSKPILFKRFQKPDEYLPIYLIHGFGTKKRNGRKRRGTGGIVQECCEKSNGCSWEEYAEYCPGHNRRRGGSLIAEN